MLGGQKCPLDSPLQVLVVQVVQMGRRVRGCQGFQAHHLFLEVQDFPREKKERIFALSPRKDSRRFQVRNDNCEKKEKLRSWHLMCTGLC